MPPLRERKPDVRLLADYFPDKYGREHDKLVKRISTPAIDMLTSDHCPGNARELKNIVERAVLDGGHRNQDIAGDNGIANTTTSGIGSLVADTVAEIADRCHAYHAV